MAKSTSLPSFTSNTLLRTSTGFFASTAIAESAISFSSINFACSSSITRAITLPLLPAFFLAS